MFENYYFAKGKEESAKLRAKTVMKHTSNMGDYYYNVGVQDFTAGLDFIQEIERTTNVNFLSSNLYDEKTDNLLFDNHVILERNNIKIAIFGVTRELQVEMKGVRVEGYIDVAKIKIEELKPQVDILVMLVNATKKDYDPFLKDISGVDYIFSSLEASKTRPGIQQVIGRPFEYQLGIQGKNIGRFDIYISEKGKPLQDVSSQMTMLNLYTQRLNKLQERDPKRKVEDIYKNSPNVLSTITKLKDGIKTSKETLKKAKNRSSFTMIPLSGSVASEKAILRDVDKVLERCKELDEQSTLTS